MQRAQDLLLKRNQQQRGYKAYQPLEEGDKVWLEGKNLHMSHPFPKLAPKHYGPFLVEQVINPMVFKLRLPEQWKQKRLHPVFHASLLSPYKETEEHGLNFLEPPPDIIEGEEEYEVEQVLDSRHSGRKKQLQYLLKWKGYSEVHNSWGPADQVHATELIEDYHKQKLTAVKSIKRLVIKPSINMSQSTPSFTLGYTWDQLHLATVDLDNCQKKATLEAEAYFFDPTKQHRRPGQPNSITYKQV
jgi:Chromo (CHRromatin Organisation MOdifier) domain